MVVDDGDTAGVGEEVGRGTYPVPPLCVDQPEPVEGGEVGGEGAEGADGEEVFVEGEELLDAGVCSPGEDYEGWEGGGGFEFRGGGGVAGVVWVGCGPEFGEAYGGGEGVEIGCAVG